MDKKIFLLATVSLFLLVSSCKKKEEAKEIQYVKTAVAIAVDDEAQLSYPGKTKAAEDVNVAFRVSGPIQRVLVKEGDYVKKGQLIAELDPRDYRVQLAATEAEYARIKADAERVIAVYNEGSTTASSYDQARFGLQQITEKLEHHRNQLADTKLYAPISGYIQTKLHEAGETVGAGMPVVSMFSAGGLEVEIHVSASDYARRDRMTAASCTFDVLPGETFPLQVVRTSREANASQLYTVRFRPTGSIDRQRVTPGMSTMVSVTYDAPNVKQIVKVPTSAVLHKNDRVLVYVLDKKTGRIAERNVELGEIDLSGQIQIVKGLKPRETVVSAGVRYLNDGQEVQEIKPTSKANVGGLL